MAKRARYTLHDVLHFCDDDDDSCAEYDERLDDPDEPVMEGSDDEFSDCEFEDEDGYDGDANPSHVASPMPGTPTVTASPSIVPTTDTSTRASPSVDPTSDTTRASPSVDPTSDTTGASPAFTWTSTPQHLTIHPFTSPVGPTVGISSSPKEVFDLFFSPDLLDKIVTETNNYAAKVMGAEKYAGWSKVTVEELRAFLGFKILMGINHLPSLDDYWSRDPFLRYAPVADRISRDRFRDISRYLHFVDNDTLLPRGTDGHDRLGKVRPVIDHLAAKFAGLYRPHREVSVDEAMIKFQGRSSLKQYLPMKPIKRGFKVWVMADSSNGYFSRFEVYTGKTGGSVEHGLGARVVKTLISELKGKYHHAFFDNYFTSLSLLEDLAKDDIYSCGTARKDRKGFPQVLKEAKLKNR